MKGFGAQKSPAFFRDGDWAQSHPDMMEILGKLEALGQPNLCILLSWCLIVTWDI